jgi:hypothetical protein
LPLGRIATRRRLMTYASVPGASAAIHSLNPAPPSSLIDLAGHPTEYNFDSARSIGPSATGSGVPAAGSDETFTATVELVGECIRGVES